MGAGLRYAVPDGVGGWTIETVDSGATNTGRACSLVLEPSPGGGQTPVAAFASGPSSARRLRFGRRPPTGWQIETADSLAGTINDIDLAISAGGEPRIAYSRGGILPTAVRLGARGTSWSFGTIESSVPGCGYGLSMVIDALGRTHLAYQCIPGPFISGGLTHAVDSAGVVAVELLDDGQSAGSGPATPRTSIKVDPSGQLWISEPRSDHQTIDLVSLGKGDWYRVPVDSIYHAGGSEGLGTTSLAIGPDGRIHIAYATDYGEGIEVWHATSALPTGVPVGAGMEARPLRVWPNPVRGTDVLRASVALDVAGEVTASLFDLAGRRVWSSPGQFVTAGRQDLAWPLPALPVGVHFVRIHAGAVPLGSARVVILE